MNELSSNSGSRGGGSFIGGMSGDNPMGGDSDEDYGSEENSGWADEGYYLDMQDMEVGDQPEVIVTTKQDNNSPRHRRSFEDYDEEDSSSNFNFQNEAMPPSEEDEDESSDSYGSQDVDV